MDLSQIVGIITNHDESWPIMTNHDQSWPIMTSQKNLMFPFPNTVSWSWIDSETEEVTVPFHLSSKHLGRVDTTSQWLRHPPWVPGFSGGDPSLVTLWVAPSSGSTWQWKMNVKIKLHQWCSHIKRRWISHAWMWQDKLWTFHTDYITHFSQNWGWLITIIP